jgi:hypothetical protein
MIDAQPLPGGAGEPRKPEAGRTEDVAQRTSELVEFRDAGLLTEAEFQEQMAKARWGIP